jgi:hypothetical protein
MVPGAPRKGRHSSPISSSEDEEPLFAPVRRLSFGIENETKSKPWVSDGWEDFDVSDTERIDARSRELLELVNHICSSSLEARGECSLGDLKQCLRCNSFNVDNLSSSLSQLDSRWIQVTRDGRVIFPGDISVGEVIRALYN